MAQHEVVVLGAGVVGLSAAVCIQETRPDCHVTLLAETFSPHTTSDGSAGLWFPYCLQDTDPTLTAEIGKSTYEHLKKLCLSPLAGEVGAQHFILHYLYEAFKEKHDDVNKDNVDGFRKLTASELQMYPGSRSGFALETVAIDMPSYLKWLMLRLKASGGTVRCQKIKSISELCEKWNVVINCCGLGAAELWNDKSLIPAKGQILTVEAPWIKQCFIHKTVTGSVTHVIPGVNGVFLGCTALAGDWNTEVREDLEKDIWNRAVHFFPQIAKARKIKSWVGLRPSRTSLRLESEVKNVGNRQATIIHNYGHGGAGLTLSWGCAQKVLSMLSDILPSGKTARTQKASLKHRL